MTQFATRYGADMYRNDWGLGRPIAFSHGWPLSTDDFEDQMFFLVSRGIAASRMTGAATAVRASPRTATICRYADDLADLDAHLDLTNAIHVGRSTSGGEVAPYVGGQGTMWLAKAVLIGAVPPVMVKTESNPWRPAAWGIR